jgi:mRNA interferase YafQ
VRNPISLAQSRRDVKLAGKRGNDMSKLREAIMLVAAGDPLPARYRDHALGGNRSHHRDCPIESNWRLIYKVDGDDLYLVRTGRQSDLF